MGHEQQAQGAELEQQLIEQCGVLYRWQKALVERRRPPMKTIGMASKGVHKAVATGEPCCDFEGMLAGGRAVVFDAKTCSELQRFPFAEVRETQLARAQAVTNMGGIGFLYVRRIDEVRATDYILPVDGAGRIAGQAHRRCLLLFARDARESIRWDAIPVELIVRRNELWGQALERILAGTDWFDMRRAG